MTITDWLAAVAEDRWEMIDTDRRVAVALSEGATSVDGVDPAAFCDAVDNLLGVGFVESVARIPCAGHGKVARGDEVVEPIDYEVLRCGTHLLRLVMWSTEARGLVPVEPEILVPWWYCVCVHGDL